MAWYDNLIAYNTSFSVNPFPNGSFTVIFNFV